MFMRIGVLAVITLVTAGCDTDDYLCTCVTTEGGYQAEILQSQSCQGVADVQPDTLYCTRNPTKGDIMAPFDDYDLEVSTGVATREAGWYQWDELVMLGS